MAEHEHEHEHGHGHGHGAAEPARPEPAPPAWEPCCRPTGYERRLGAILLEVYQPWLLLAVKLPPVAVLRIGKTIALVFTEGVNLEIGDDAKKAIARLATQINRDVENIGARRLHTIMERLTEELAFTATDRAGESVAIGAADVETAVESIAKKTDLSRFIL